MKRVIPKVVSFGLGFKVPVTWRGRIPGRMGQYNPTVRGGPEIELRANVPLWEQYEAYAHEVLHAAIDFGLWVRQELVDPLLREAVKTEHLLRKGDE